MGKKNLVTSFSLTQEQIAIMQPLFDQIIKDNATGYQGVIVCQIAQFEGMDYSLIKAKYFPHKRACRIMFAIDPDKFIEQVQSGNIKPIENKEN